MLSSSLGMRTFQTSCYPQGYPQFPPSDLQTRSRELLQEQRAPSPRQCVATVQVAELPAIVANHDGNPPDARERSGPKGPCLDK